VEVVSAGSKQEVCHFVQNENRRGCIEKNPRVKATGRRGQIEGFIKVAGGLDAGLGGVSFFKTQEKHRCFWSGPCCSLEIVCMGEMGNVSVIEGREALRGGSS